MCLTNESTSGELHYDCTQGGGESHYVCVMQGSVHEIHDRVDAMATSTGMLEGTIERVSTTYSPPNCTVTARCSDSGSFELLLQR